MVLTKATVNPLQRSFTIRAASQTKADFDVPVSAVLGQPELTPQDHARATKHVVTLILRSCGLLS